MLRLTRLHLLLGLIGLILIGYGFYSWKNVNSPFAARNTLPEPTFSNPTPTVAATPPSNQSSSSDDLLAKTPSVTAPAVATNATTYEVVRGDSLWRIAAEHSPVHQGPGWVTIWRVNQHDVKNFNRIEVGQTLTIPAEPDRYVTAFWKPSSLNRTTASATTGTIAKTETLPRDLELALLRNEPMPNDIAVALRRADRDTMIVYRPQNVPLPKAVELALLKTDREQKRAAKTTVVRLASPIPVVSVEAPKVLSVALLSGYPSAFPRDNGLRFVPSQVH